MTTVDRGPVAPAPRPVPVPWEALLLPPLAHPVVRVPYEGHIQCPRCQRGYMYNYVPTPTILFIVLLGVIGCVVLGVYAYCCLVSKRCAACSYVAKKDLVNKDWLREPDTDVSPPPCPVTSWKLGYAA